VESDHERRRRARRRAKDEDPAVNRGRDVKDPFSHATCDYFAGTGTLSVKSYFFSAATIAVAFV
jgi:hypothetical protein